MTLLMTVVFLLSMIGWRALAISDDTVAETPMENTETTDTAPTYTYAEYVQEIKNYAAADATIVLRPENIVESSQVDVIPHYEEYDGDCVILKENSQAVYSFTVSSAGLYQIEWDYYPMEGTSNRIERRLLLDGKVPFEELETVVFSRRWSDDGEILVDSKGNESRPSQAEKPAWQKVKLSDCEGFYDEPFSVYLDAGVHTFAVAYKREPMAVGEIRLVPAVAEQSYAQVQQTYTYPKAEGTIVVDSVEAETAIGKSDATLYATWDRSSPMTAPMDYYALKLNTIGGTAWGMAGQWLEWTISVPQDGLYRLGFRARQNFTTGLNATRKLTIDGNVPFEEAQHLTFPYGSNWQYIVLGDEQGDYWFELDAGEHTLRLEVVLGEMGEIIRQTDAVLLELNRIYREILVITGSSPDLYRDYYIDRELPDTMKRMGEMAKTLRDLSQAITDVVGESSDQNIYFDRLALQMEQMVEEPELVAKKFASFKNNISALGTWTLNIRQQPLELDRIDILADATPIPSGDAGFFKSLIHELKLFFAAFTTDYANVGSSAESKDALEVWVSTGREQATILNQLVAREYVGKVGGEVSVQLVAGSTLLPSILSHRGPDVALGIGGASVMDFAARDALLDLSEFFAGSELKSAFHESALIPLQYQGRQYGIPEAQSFPVLFYRSDILEQLGVSLPETWTDLYDVLHKLQKNHMEFGMPADTTGYAMFLYQNGGAFYNEEQTRSLLDTDVAVEAFRDFTNLYVNYGLPQVYDFANRFRSGEMPMAIADYSVYNQLSVFAPEIDGLWGFAPIIGTRKEDGTVDRSVTTTVSGAIVLKETQHKDEAYRFLSWWCGKEAQTTYAREQESIMGTAARYTVANREAFEQLPWDVEQATVLKEQWEYVKAIPEVPGGYYTGRYVGFAFKDVVIQKENLRDVLLRYTVTINKEIDYKRREFGLKVYGEE